MNRAAGLLAGVALLAAACGAPFAIERNVVGAQRKAVANVVATGELSRRTRNVLYERGLETRYRKDPTGALSELHADFTSGRLRPEAAGPIAELGFDHARKGGGRPYYLAAALYAWAYLFPDDAHARPDRHDPGVALATELYNRGLALGFRKDDEAERVDLAAGSYPLPFGTLEVDFDPASLVWGDHQLYDFYPLTDIEVTGFPTYYRWPGLGAPLAARVIAPERDADLLGKRVRVPVTAVLEPTRGLADALRQGTVRAKLTAYPGYGDAKFKVGDLDVPVGAEPTATIGLTLAETALWKQELTLFLGGAVDLVDRPSRLISVRPYEPGLIPVVFVHGTGSSVVRWAELYNELDNDPRIHARYQFWFFSYDSGSPIIYSSWQLRDALQHAVATLDPEGRDPALRRMVVMGHSQGGLLTKMTVVESGDAFWRNVSDRPFDDVRMSPETRDLLRKVGFVHPLPFVGRVVFVATPHHGSYIAGNWLAHQFARLISMPLSVTKVMTDLATLNRESRAIRGTRGAPTAVDNMTPGNPFVKTLASLPVAPGVPAHSIIAVDGDPPYPGKDDGVVEYESAHIDGVESEVVVRSPHSCQSHPDTMNEVRRILLTHLGASPHEATKPPRAAARTAK